MRAHLLTAVGIPGYSNDDLVFTHICWKNLCMAAIQHDWDILWVLLLAAACWFALWNHKDIGAWIDMAWAYKSLLY